MNEVKIRVKWYCGCFIGLPKWQTTEIYEPDECSTEFETEELLTDWENGNCETKCPDCKAELSQFDGNAISISNLTSSKK